MGKEDKPETGINDLTEEEKRLLANAIKQIERDLLDRILKRLTYMLGVFVALLTVGGLVSWSSCSANIENNAVQKMANDPELRDKIIQKAQSKSTDVEKLISENEKESARILQLLNYELKRINSMTERANEEIQNQNLEKNEK